MMDSLTVLAACVAAGISCEVEEHESSFRLSVGESTVSFRQLAMLGEALKTDRINVVKVDGFRTECTYEPDEYYLEILK